MLSIKDKPKKLSEKNSFVKTIIPARDSNNEHISLIGSLSLSLSFFLIFIAASIRLSFLVIKLPISNLYLFFKFNFDNRLLNSLSQSATVYIISSLFFI